MNPLDIRIAADSDIALLLELMEPFNRLEQVPWQPVAKERALRTLLGDPSLGIVALLESAEGIAGYFVLTWGYDLEWDGRDAFLTELFLVPSARGRGLGAVALEHAEALARAHAARALHLMVRNDNAIARRLYARGGFTSPERIFLSKAL
ncbi:MAG TPA: GNAT family N-acetyltransferase [Polyangiaceae bacterium]|nr:GNAT family N-acetyltransferase [Polyangiaceae bacterium]